MGSIGRAVSATLVLVAALASAASAALTNPHIFRSVTDLWPNGCGGVSSVAYLEGYVYVTGDGYANYCINVADPNDIVYSDRYIPGAGHAYQMCVSNGKLYAANWFTYLDVYDPAAVPGKFTHLGNFSVPGLAAFSMDVGYNRAYIGESNWPNGGFRIVNVSDPANMSTISTSLPGETSVSGVAVRGSYAYLIVDHSLKIMNISNEAAPVVASSTDLGVLLFNVKVRGNYAYITSVYDDGGLWIYDISNPTSPVFQSHISGPIGPIYLMGDYLFTAGGSNKLCTVNISNPTYPYIVTVTNCINYSDAANGWESAVCGNGKHIYVGTGELYWASGNNYYRGKVYCFQAFGTDPDNIGPNNWSSFTPTEASWETQYEGDALPTASSPAWTVYSGSEASSSISSGVLRINDTGAGDVRWSRNWDATNCRGATVLCRARCAAYSLNGQPGASLGNIFLEDGRYSERFVILSDRIRASTAQLEYLLDGTQWHTYRITTQGTQFRVYVDEGATPVMTGNLFAATSRARVMFGSGLNPASQDIYFDYIHCFSNGAYGPSATITDATPDISVTVADSRDPGSVSGIDPASTFAYWSTDAGATWTRGGWDLSYNCDVLPSVASPLWFVNGGAENPYATVSAGVLRVNDNSTASNSKITWYRNWTVNRTVGATVTARAKCASIGGDQSILSNITVMDGYYYEKFKLTPSQLIATGSGQTYSLDATQWHTYRITTKNSQYTVYLDENPTPIMTGALPTSTTTNRLIFGGGESTATQDIYFDYLNYSIAGALPPGPDALVVCTGSPGSERAMITAYSVPFNQRSETQNKIKFSVKDMNGNTGYSPVYNVRILPGIDPPGPVTSFTATGGDGQVTLNWHTPSDASFRGTMIRYKTTGYPYGTNDGTLLISKAGTPGTNDSCTHTCLNNNGVTYYYSAFAYDTAPNYSPKVDASGGPNGAYCFSDTFTYGSGNLSSVGCWSGDSTSTIQVSNQTVKMIGGSPEYITGRDLSCSFGSLIQVHVDIKSGSGTQTMWGLWVDDPFGANIARWYGSGTTAKGRIGGTGRVTDPQTLTGGWDSLDVRINTATQQSEFFFNGVSIGVLSYDISLATNQVGRVWFQRIANTLAANNTIYFDNLRLGPTDSTPPGPVSNFRAASGNGAVSLSWANPTNPDFIGTKILYKTTGYPTSVTDGTLLYNGSATTCPHSPATNGIRYYYSAFAYDGFMNYSSAAHAVTTPAVEATIAQAKALDDGQKRLLKGKIVSAAFSGFFYVVEPGWIQGIRVLSSEPVAAGNLVDIVGAMGGAGSERFLDTGGDNVIVTTPGPGAPPARGTTNRVLGGGSLNAKTPGVRDGMGVNNVGLPVTAWGKVTATGTGFFYLDDGSGVIDTRINPATGQAYTGVRIYGSASVNLDEYWSAVGVCTCDVYGSDKLRAVLATSSRKLSP